MITVSTAMTVSQASEYFVGENSDSGKELLEAFNHNLTTTDFELSKTGWGGQLANRFYLEGEVKKADFDKTLNGQNPITNEKLIRHRQQKSNEKQTDNESPNKKNKKNNETENKSLKTSNDTARVKLKTDTFTHRACWDITFSAPKSVSLVAIVGADWRLIEAHRQAVSTAMEEVENFAQARLGGNKPPENTGKLLTASFEHYAARPDKKKKFATVDLHTHNAVMNFTFAENGRSYSLQPKKLFDVQKFGTAVYRLELAKKMNNLGYELKIDEKTQAPEISSISRDYIEAVSLRQEEIKAKAKELNITSTRGIAVRYRSAKNNKNTNNVELHRKIEAKFNFQATNAVREAKLNTKIEQPAIISKLETEVKKLQQQIFDKEAEKKQKYQAKKTESELNEQSVIEINFGTDKINGQTETPKKRESATFIPKFARNDSNIFESSDEHLPAQRISYVQGNGSSPTPQRISGSRAVANSGTNSTNQAATIGSEQIDREGGESFGKFGQPHQSNSTERQDDCRESDQNSKSTSSSTSSESLTGSAAGKLKTFKSGQTAENITDSPVEQSSESSSQTGSAQTKQADDYRNEESSVPALRTDLSTDSFNLSSSQAFIQDDLSTRRTTENERSSGRNKAVAGTLPKFTVFSEDTDFNPSLFAGNNADALRIGGDNGTNIFDLADNGILGNNSDDYLSRDSSNFYPYHFNRFDDVSANRQGIVGNDSGIYTDGLDSDWIPGEPGQKDFDLSEQLRFSDDSSLRLSDYHNVTTDLSTQSTTTDPFQGFIEVQNLFEAQAKQESLASQIVETANNLQLQNQGCEISQSAQAQMFSYLMQFSQIEPTEKQNGINQTSNNPQNSIQPTPLETFHQELQHSPESTQVLEQLTAYFDDLGQAEQPEFERKNSVSTSVTELDEEEYDQDELDDELECDEGQVLSFF